MLKNQLLREPPFSQSNFTVSIFLKLPFVVLFLTSFLSVANAQDFEVAPVKLNYDCEPGEIQTKTVTIRNHDNKKQQFTLTAVDMKFDSINPKNKSCKDWITINPSFFDINPNDKAEVKVIMQVPSGEFNTRGALIHVSATQEQTALAADKQMVKSALTVKPRISIKVVQSPRSNSNYKGTITDLKEITLPKDSVRTFQVKVSNPGDKVIDSKIYLVLSDLATAKEIKDKPRRLSLFPGTSQTISLNFPKNIPPGKYSLAAILDYGNNSSLEAVQMNVEVK